MQRVTDDSFNNRVIKPQAHAIVLFETDWSGHCQIMLSILNKLQVASGNQWLFFELDIEASPKTANRFNVGRVPTILIFKRGELIDRITGIMSETELSFRIQGWNKTSLS